MTDDPAAAPRAVGGGDVYLQAIESLRDDVREDIGHLRDDYREDLAAVEGRIMATVIESLRVEREDNRSYRATNDAKHQAIDDFIRSSELAMAHRDGAIGVFHYAIELLSRHWKPLAALTISAGGTLAILLGNVSIQVVTR